MFKETIDDADRLNVCGIFGVLELHTIDPADHHSYLHTLSACLVELANHTVVRNAVDLHPKFSFFTRFRKRNFLIDQGIQSFSGAVWTDQQMLEFIVLVGRLNECKHLSSFLGDALIGGQQVIIGIDFGRSFVVISCTYDTVIHELFLAFITTNQGQF